MKEKKSLIIVYDEKTTKEYAEFLQALISQTDDKEGKIVGTKDGMVSAAIYNQKEFKDTLPKLTNDTHILYIGNFKETKSLSKYINVVFDKFGMKYGWLGKKAVMYVERDIKQKELEEFFIFNKQYQVKFETEPFNVTHMLTNTIKDIISPLPLKVMNYTKSIDSLPLKDQQYRCLTMVLYLEDLQKFLEG